MKLMIIILCLLLCYLIWQYQELKKFEVTEYELHSKKVTEELRIVMISDLHAHVYGKDNEPLFSAVREKKPDLILIPGDMIVGKKPASYETAYRAFEGLVPVAPVYFSNGNHESKPARKNLPYSPDFFAYEKKVKKLGVHILNNASETVRHGADEINIYGAEIDMACYAKGKKVPLADSFLEEHLGKAGDSYNILLAHNPAYSPKYAAWGADLSLCGHNHGGLVRIPGIGSLISPQFVLFSKYDAGRFSFGQREVIIGRGLGTHTFHIRIFNRAELVFIRVLPEK